MTGCATRILEACCREGPLLLLRFSVLPWMAMVYLTIIYNSAKVADLVGWSTRQKK